MTLEFNLDPVGVVRSTRVEAEDDQWDSESSSIEVLPPFGDRALLSTFSTRRPGTNHESLVIQEEIRIGLKLESLRNGQRIARTASVSRSVEYLASKGQRFVSVASMQSMEHQLLISNRGWLSSGLVARLFSLPGQAN
jgi:hypothetical protein